MNFLWREPCGREPWKAPRSWGWPLADRQQYWSCQPYSCKKKNSANNLSELGRRFPSIQASTWEQNPTDMLIEARWDPEAENSGRLGSRKLNLKKDEIRCGGNQLDSGDLFFKFFILVPFWRPSDELCSGLFWREKEKP